MYDVLITEASNSLGGDGTEDKKVLWLTLNIGIRQGPKDYEGSFVGFMFHWSCFIGDNTKWIVLASLVAAWAYLCRYEKNVVAAECT